MAFSITWNESYPAGTDLGSGIDTYIQQDKIAVRERMESLLGIADFSTRDPMTADVFAMSGIANSYIKGGSVSWGVKDTTGATYNLQVTDAGVLTVRAGLTITAGTTTTKQLDVSGAQARIIEFDAGDSGAALAIDWDDSNNQKITLTANTTLTFSNPIAGCWYQLRLVQNAVGSKTVTWPANVKWQSGVAPTLTTTASYTDIIALYYNGTNYLATIAGLNWNG